MIWATLTVTATENMHWPFKKTKMKGQVMIFLGFCSVLSKLVILADNQIASESDVTVVHSKTDAETGHHFNTSKVYSLCYHISFCRIFRFLITCFCLIMW